MGGTSNAGIPSALSTKTRHKNSNIEDSRRLMAQHMLKAPRGITEKYVAKNELALAERLQDPDAIKEWR